MKVIANSRPDDIVRGAPRPTRHGLNVVASAGGEEMRMKQRIVTGSALALVALLVGGATPAAGQGEQGSCEPAKRRGDADRRAIK